MKKRFTFITATVLLLGIAGAASAQTHHEEYDFKDFDKLTLGETLDSPGNNTNPCRLEVTLVQSDDYMVSFDVEERNIDKYEVSMTNGNLSVKVKSVKVKDYVTLPKASLTVHLPSIKLLDIQGAVSVTAEGTFERKGPVEVEMSGATTVDGLNVSASSVSLDFSGAAKFFNSSLAATGRLSIDLSGAVKLKSMKFNASRLSFEVSGAANLNDSEAYFDTADFVISGAAIVSLSGEGDSLDLDVSGTSKINMSELKCSDVSVVATGVTKTNVYASKSLTYDVSTMSFLDYYGDPGTVSGKSDKVRAR